jgi:hypothetical protein
VVAGIGFKGICVGYQWQHHFQLEETHCLQDMQVVVKSPSEEIFFSRKCAFICVYPVILTGLFLCMLLKSFKHWELH